MPGWFKRWLLGPETGEGFGQSVLDDLLYWWRYRACRRRFVRWRQPTAAEAARWDAHPVVGRFADSYAVACVDGQDWVLRDRIWSGWPDPPEFAFFVLDTEAIRVAIDFDGWPSAWTRPDYEP